MKNGIKILIHNNIDEHDKNEIEKWLYNWIVNKYDNGIVNYKIGYSNSSSFYRRGILGFSLFNDSEHPLKNKYFFKRLTKNRRIFGVIPINELIDKNTNQIPDTNMCMCAIHLGGIKVKLKKDFNENDYSIFFQIGEIRG